MGAFQDRTVFITGASSGIGASLALEFAKQGANVAAAARREDRLEALCQEIQDAGGRAIPLRCDVCDRASLDAAIAACVAYFGGLDIAIANAGFGVSGHIQKLNTEDFRRQFETNFFGAVDTLYAALPHLEAARGQMVFISSVMGRVGLPASGPYNASKFAITGLAESIYYDLADKGVSVTSINPGFVTSEFRNVNNEGKHSEGGDPAPAWLVIPRATAARAIVRAVRKRKPEADISGHAKVTCFLSRHFPRCFRFALRSFSRGRIDKIEAVKRGPNAI